MKEVFIRSLVAITGLVLLLAIGLSPASAQRAKAPETTKTNAGRREVKLLQGDTTIQAATLTLDESNGNLVANGKVITNLMIASHQETPAGKSKPTLARAEQFAYADQTRTATYTTNAQLEGDEFTYTQRAGTVRVGNVCQISRKPIIVSGTAEAVDKAGRKKVMDSFVEKA